MINELTRKTKTAESDQMNKARAQLYDIETETWLCLKCEKKYTKQNARSARSHATERKNKEGNERTDKGKRYSEHDRNKTRAKSDYELSDTMEMNIEE